MDTLGIKPVVAIPTSARPSQSAPVLPKAAEAPVVSQAAAAPPPRQQRSEPAPVRTQPIANANVLGTDTFVSFIVNGQLVTRYREEDGTVRYVPKPPEASRSDSGSTVNIEA